MDEDRRLLLEELALRHPDRASALAEAAGLRALLELPRPVVHVISDIHGEHGKLRHVINNASGSLRPLVESLFAGEMDAGQTRDFLTLIYYPRRFMEHASRGWADERERHDWTRLALERIFRIVRHLQSGHRGRVWEDLTPPHHRELFRELINAPTYRRSPEYIRALLEALAEHDQDLAAVRDAARLVRNLSVSEIIVAGDLGDRGPRIDRVIETLRQQPRVSLIWGNHDISWLGACVGQQALIATVLRMSLRYLRLWQLEEGYGIILTPLEKLVRACYRDDPASRFASKRGATTRPADLVARMQKACAILQSKLEARTILRHPEWGMQDRVVLDRIDFERGTLQIDGTAHPLLDAHFPTIDPADPLALHPAEEECIGRLERSFLASSRLWEHMRWVVERGAMSAVRDECAIFHACIPCDADGRFLELRIDGRDVAGRAMFEAFETIVRRVYARGGHTAPDDDKDWLYYLWAGPRSPLFGKDRMATFESYFLEDPATRHETKNPYFRLLHQHDFADRVAVEMGVPKDGLVVNGHIPVRPEKGEHPVKKGRNAVTIDGAFSEAYGDRGYTLILAPERTALAEHHHIDSIEEAIETRADIIPSITTVREYPCPRRIADTPDAKAVRSRIAALEALAEAFAGGTLGNR